MAVKKTKKLSGQATVTTEISGNGRKRKGYAYFIG